MVTGMDIGGTRGTNGKIDGIAIGTAVMTMTIIIVVGARAGIAGNYP